MELRILPKNIADMIAAGEVVQRPASVVKELLENAVDAGATSIKLIVTDAGRTLVQVIDNGEGMNPDDAVLCFERHATSKLESASDLHNIHTFGFRGEALASIAAVSEVTLRTRKRGEDLGVEVSFAGSQHTGTREVSTPEGCNFCVRNLFYNIPARRKFLKSDSVELRHIVEEFQRVALTRPEIAFSLTHGGKDIHVVKPAPSFKFRIQDLLGQNLVGDIMDIEAQTSTCTIRGYVGRPEAAKKTLGNQFFFVNGRFFRSPYLHKAVMKAYENYIPEGVTPSYFIYLEVDPATIDVNIHPTKTEIKFQDEPMLFQSIYGAIREVMGRSSLGSSIDFDNPEGREIPVIGPRFQDYRPISIPTEGVDLSYNPFDPAESLLGEKTPATEPSYGGGPTSRFVRKNENYGVLFQERTLPAAQVLLVEGRYMVSQGASGLMIVHIRRARERVLYERFIKAVSANAHVSQVSMFPEQVTVGVQGRLLFEENAALLSKLGFDIVPFGNDVVTVNAVPEGFSAEPGKAGAMVESLLEVLREDKGALKEMMQQGMAAKFASLGAQQSPRMTSPSEAQRLLEALLQCESPEYTPGGRKILSILTSDELEKRF